MLHCIPNSLELKLAVAVVTVTVVIVQQLTSQVSLEFTGRVSGSPRTIGTLAIVLLSDTTTFSPKSNGFPERDNSGNFSILPLMLRLHYVPSDHGSRDFGHRGRNGVTVTQRRGTGSTNVARRGCRDRRDRFLNSQKICHGSHGSHGGIDLLKCAVVERGERNKT